MRDLARLPSPSPPLGAPASLAHRGGRGGLNPYDLDGTAERLGAAIAMPEPQRRGRMTRLRERVLGWNIHRWVGEVLGTVLRLPDPEVIS